MLMLYALGFVAAFCCVLQINSFLSKMPECILIHMYLPCKDTYFMCLVKYKNTLVQADRNSFLMILTTSSCWVKSKVFR